MLLDNIYRKVKTFVNTDVYGSVTPTDFELLTYDAIQSRNEDYLYELNRQNSRQNRGLIISGISNLPDRLREKLAHYRSDAQITARTDAGLDTETKVTTIDIPSDLRYLEDITTDADITIEIADDKRSFNILKSQARIKCPIAYIKADKIDVFPKLEVQGVGPAETLVDPITVSFIRKIKYPKWTYTEVDGVELFNPSSTDFVDADIHISEEDEIVRRILLRFGVNLKEEDLRQYAMAKDASEFNQQNAS